MGRKSVKEVRRKEIIESFAKVLAQKGYAASTMNAISNEAGISPGLIHHHFKNKDEMLIELLVYLISNFKARLRSESPITPKGYLTASLELNPKSNKIIAQCWVGIFAEAIRNPQLFNKVKSHIATEVELIGEISKGELDSKSCTAILAYIIGSLVMGSFYPIKSQGFALEGGLKLLKK